MSDDMTQEMIDRRDYGRLEAQVAQLVTTVGALQSEVASIRSIMQEARGGWKAVAFVGGISSTVTGGIIAVGMWISSHVQFIR